jgi:hypothetical protein
LVFKEEAKSFEDFKKKMFIDDTHEKIDIEDILITGDTTTVPPVRDLA